MCIPTAFMVMEDSVYRTVIIGEARLFAESYTESIADARACTSAWYMRKFVRPSS